MDPNFRLRTATRLHFLLLRRYGQDIAVAQLLGSKDRLHDGLWLCAVTGDAELIALARQLAEANRAHDEAEARAKLRELATALHASANEPLQEIPWDMDTTVFGMTVPQDLPALPRFVPPSAGRWFNPRRWLKRERPRQYA